MIGIVDYGVGNLFSLKSSFAAIGADAVVSPDPDVLSKADRIILPGVGAFGDAALKLNVGGLGDFIKEEVKKGKPLMGICLGMQLLFEKSYEYGCHEGLGLIEGEIRPISDVIPKDFKIPHIGWNALKFTIKNSNLLKYINEGDYVYFVHSFYAANCDGATVAVADHGAPLTAVVQKENVFGCQFHPEKSGKVGLSILRAFCDMEVE